MPFYMLLLLAVGLSMDAFTVAVSNGLCWGKSHKRAGLAVALVFGFAQGIMPMAGYWGGGFVTAAVHRYEGAVGLFLLGSLGCKMIWETLFLQEEQAQASEFSMPLVLAQGVATSIDALAVGLGLAVMEVPIVESALLIALVTFGVCLGGYQLGARFGERLGRGAGVLGGVILIVLGIHLFFD